MTTLFGDKGDRIYVSADCVSNSPEPLSFRLVVGDSFQGWGLRHLSGFENGSIDPSRPKDPLANGMEQGLPVGRTPRIALS